MGEAHGAIRPVGRGKIALSARFCWHPPLKEPVSVFFAPPRRYLGEGRVIEKIAWGREDERVKTDGVMPERVSAVLFDLDGVLVDSTEVVERSWRRWAQERSLPPDEVLAVAHGRPTRDVVRMLAPHLDVDEEVRLIGGYESVPSSTLVAVPGARDCVDVARRGRWAVVTSGTRDLAAERLIAAGLPVPEVLVTADDVTHGKPDPEPYERARRELNVPASECVVIEDSPPGITAAKSAGMTVLAITTTHPAGSLHEADGVFGTLDEITNCLLHSNL